MAREMRNFRWLDGDRDWLEHGGRWYRRTNSEGVYHVVDLRRAEDAVERYQVTLFEVDISDEKHLQAAMRFAGLAKDKLDEHGDPIPELHFVSAMCSYGSTAIDTRLGNNHRVLLKRARGLS